MAVGDKVNILLVDDQPAKLMSYETILAGLGENLLKATSAREALEQLLRHDVAVILVDVCMPELDGFQLAAMIREHPRFQETAIIFISAIHLTDLDRLRAYEMGAVDYVPVPVVAEVLRAKVRIFSELYRKTRQLEQLNRELERRVAERTSELQASTARLLQSEQRRSLTLAAGQMGSWEWDPVNGDFVWDDGQYRIFGVDPASFELTIDNIRALIHPEDWKHLQNAIKPAAQNSPSFQSEFRVCRPNGELRWCIGTAVASVDATDNIVRISGVTVDITDRKQAEERQALLAREVDHRARNALALVQSIVRLTRSDTIKSYIAAVDGRIGALSRAHTLLAQSRWQGANLARLVEEELAAYRMGDVEKVAAAGPDISLEPRTAQTIALALHELSTNAAKYGALSVMAGRVEVAWELEPVRLVLRWTESGGPSIQPPASPGFGIRMISASIERQLEGEATFDWRPDGLHCTGRHDDARHPDRARIFRRRPLQPALGVDGGGGARGDRRRRHRRQPRRRVRLSGRRRAGCAQHPVRVRHRIRGGEHRRPVRIRADHQEAGATPAAAEALPRPGRRPAGAVSQAATRRRARRPRGGGGAAVT